MAPSFPPPKGGEGEKRSHPQPTPCPCPPLFPCLPSGKGGEEDTRVRLESSLLVSSPDTSPSDGGGAEWGRGACAEAADLEAGEHGVMGFWDSGVARMATWGSIMFSIRTSFIINLPLFQ